MKPESFVSRHPTERNAFRGGIRGELRLHINLRSESKLLSRNCESPPGRWARIMEAERYIATSLIHGKVCFRSTDGNFLGQKPVDNGLLQISQLLISTFDPISLSYSSFQVYHYSHAISSRGD